MKPEYQLLELKSSPRDNSTFGMLFDSYETLAEAKVAAKKVLKDRPWIITETKIVAKSKDVTDKVT